MLSVRLSSEVSKVEVRIAAVRAVDAAHLALQLQPAHKLEGSGGSDVDARNVLATKQVHAVRVENRQGSEIPVDGLLPIGFGAHVNVYSRCSRLDRLRRDRRRH